MDVPGRRSELDIELAPDGTPMIGLSCYKSELDDMQAALEELIEAAQDNAYTVYDKMRDSEHSERLELVQKRDEVADAVDRIKRKLGLK